MRCPACGRPNPDDYAFCSTCGGRLGATSYAPAAEPPSLVEPAKKDIKAPVACMIIGVVVVVVGIIIYGLAITNVFQGFTDTDPMNPFSGFEDVSHDMGLIFASYGVMAVGGIIFFVGIVLLVMRLP